MWKLKFCGWSFQCPKACGLQIKSFVSGNVVFLNYKVKYFNRRRLDINVHLVHKLLNFQRLQRLSVINSDCIDAIKSLTMSGVKESVSPSNERSQLLYTDFTFIIVNQYQEIKINTWICIYRNGYNSFITIYPWYLPLTKLCCCDLQKLSCWKFSLEVYILNL